MTDTRGRSGDRDIQQQSVAGLNEEDGQEIKKNDSSSSVLLPFRTLFKGRKKGGMMNKTHNCVVCTGRQLFFKGEIPVSVVVVKKEKRKTTSPDDMTVQK